MKKPWLFRVYIGDYTTQLYRDYNKPEKGFPLNNQCIMESKAVFFFRTSRVVSPYQEEPGRSSEASHPHESGAPATEACCIFGSWIIPLGPKKNNYPHLER